MTSIISALMRQGPKGNLFAGSQLLATRDTVSFTQKPIRNRKFRSAAKEKRKQMKRDRMAATNIKDSGEEVPPFFMPQRYKLLYRIMEDHKNSGRLGRKPIPLEVKQKLGKVAKEYNEFKVAEKTLLDKEKANALRVQMQALDSILFLPDYLLAEAMSDTGQ